MDDWKQEKKRIRRELASGVDEYTLTVELCCFIGRMIRLITGRPRRTVAPRGEWTALRDPTPASVGATFRVVPCVWIEVCTTRTGAHGLPDDAGLGRVLRAWILGEARAGRVGLAPYGNGATYGALHDSEDAERIAAWLRERGAVEEVAQ